MMSNNKLKLVLDDNLGIPKYQQIINAVTEGLENNVLKIGDLLPSINAFSKDYGMARDTVFKAYSQLKKDGIVKSTPNKGYFISGNSIKVLLVLDTFKAYKEVLYGAFINNLPDNIIVDLQFHHYNPDNFKTIFRNTKGKYYKYVVMGFDHKEVPRVLSEIDKDKLLLIDWNVHSNSDNNYVFQDFGKAFYETLVDIKNRFKKYKSLSFIYPEFTYHPKETLIFFEKFCEEHQFDYNIVDNSKAFKVERGIAYISVSDRILGKFLEQCRDKALEPGVDVGFLSYNETPMKKFIYKGITVVSTNFEALGIKAAEFVTTNESIQCYIPTKIAIRESL
ncbi:GntR family transcriptional regulator [Snuella sedimenti]|uniref:GntR family transcriptional regulator n=1 Tax=Snuella sedimenti TaxID=2798802 RepID=A0A8J7IYG5_9FLAO|nr:winged helix-turn-helix domain-containing protein [Snuella sedimenti]MBJ6368915.1 GntR family transcriptional regulator [Snuella sedimenti]